MTFVAIFLFNAALSFALSLVVAHLIGPEAFGRYAIALSLSVFVNTAFFEWLRLSTTRFYSERVVSKDPRVPATLDLAYAVTSAVIAALAAAGIALGAGFRLSPGLLAAAVAAGLSIGLFEYRIAQARARFRDRRYVGLFGTRGFLAFALSAGAAILWADPAFVLAGGALAGALTLAAFHERRQHGPIRSFEPRLLLRFARYAVPFVAAGAVYQLLPLANRAVLAGRSGFAEAGHFSLASEVAVRLFQNLGSALDLALFQLAVRADEHGGRDAAERQIGRNLALVSAVVLPAAAGLVAVWPSFEAIFVPSAFRGEIAAPMMLAIPAFAAYALVQYGLSPFFQLRGRTGPVVAAAVAALVLNGALLAAWPGLAGSVPIAAAQLASLLLALATLTGLAVRSGAVLPWRDLALILAATAAMTAAIWPWREAMPPVPGLALQVGVGAIIYATAALAFDIAGLRKDVAALVRRRPRG